MVKNILFDIESTGLDFFFNHIVSIAVKDVETKETNCFYGVDEQKILEDFWNFVGDGANLISYNGDSFDCPAIIKRCIIKNVKIKNFKSTDLRKTASGFWFSYNSHEKGKLSDWATSLGMDVKTSPGSEVPRLFMENKWEEIKNHNIEDIEILEKLYNRCNDIGLFKIYNCRK
jgi:uncharacterized protein YprB with RNaseH-like and TPR domain